VEPLPRGREKQSLALGVLAMMLAVRSGSTRLPLDPKGPGAELVASVVKAAGLGGEVSVREVMKDLRNLASGFHGVAGPARRTGDQASPLVVDDDALYPHRLWWLESPAGGDGWRGRLGRAHGDDRGEGRDRRDARPPAERRAGGRRRGRR
jgi:hypothetical protein